MPDMEESDTDKAGGGGDQPPDGGSKKKSKPNAAFAKSRVRKKRKREEAKEKLRQLRELESRAGTGLFGTIPCPDECREDVLRDAAEIDRFLERFRQSRPQFYQLFTAWGHVKSRLGIKTDRKEG